jgi:hypothetical protein
MDGWLAFNREIPGTAGWSSPSPIPGMFMPAMDEPSICMPPGAMSCDLVCSEWQSELIEANEQETSHAAANEETDSNSAAIEPANMRLIIMPISILRQSVSPLQPPEITDNHVQNSKRALATEKGLI